MNVGILGSPVESYSEEALIPSSFFALSKRNFHIKKATFCLGTRKRTRWQTVAPMPLHWLKSTDGQMFEWFCVIRTLNLIPFRASGTLFSRLGDNPEMLVKAKLDLKLDGETVTGTFESSSRLGNGAINGSWVDNTLKITLERNHLTPTLAGTLQKGKLSGDWGAGHMQGRWEAKKKKDKETSSRNETHRPRKH